MLQQGAENKSMHQERSIGRDASIDAAAGDISFSKTTPGNEHDVLEDLAITALGKGGEVLVLPPERMPTVSGVAAIFRHE